eukprot:gene30682-35706_t
MTSFEQQPPEYAPDPATSHPDPEFANFFAGCAEGSRYVVHEVIGKGSYGIVVSATERLSGERVAIKKIVNVFDNVFELEETDLHEVIRANDDLSPDHHKVFLYQLLRGLNYIHQCGVLHRDLKPGNILANSDCKLKLCDFGLARPVLPQSPSDTRILWTDYVATRFYRAPELVGCLHGCYTQAVDIWSLGCIYAELMLRRPLFRGYCAISLIQVITDVIGKPSNESIQKICNRKARMFLQAMPHKDPVSLTQSFPGADPEGLDLLRQMLAFDPQDRPTAEEALTHPYFDGIPKPPQDVPVPIQKHFEFKHCNLTDVADIRRLVYNEILHHHPRVQALHAEIQALHAEYSRQQVMSMLVDQYGPHPYTSVRPTAYDPHPAAMPASHAGPAVDMPSYPQVQPHVHMSYPLTQQQQQQTMCHADFNPSAFQMQPIQQQAIQHLAILQQAMAAHLQQLADPGAAVASVVLQRVRRVDRRQAPESDPDPEEPSDILPGGHRLVVSSHVHLPMLAWDSSVVLTSMWSPAVVTYTCRKCLKELGDERALEQHRKDKHAHRPCNLLPLHELKNPVDKPGEWRSTEDFVRQFPKRRKSFGAFKCMPCERTWVSAHAFPKYKEGCQGCNQEYRPIYLWHNFQSGSSDADSDDSGDDGSDKPHDSRRCEACRLGVCKEFRQRFRRHF